MSASLDLARGSLRVLLGRAFSLVLGFVAWALLARSLGPHSYGLLQFQLAVFYYLAYAADLGLATLGAREYPKRANQAALVGTLVSLRLGLALLGTAAMVAFAALAPIDLDNRGILLVLSSWLVAAALDHTWVLRGQERATAIAVSEVAGAAAMLVAVVAVVHSPGDVVLGATAAAASPWITSILATALAARRIGFNLRFTRAAWPMVKAALPLGLSGLAIAVYYNIDSILLGVFRGSTDVGLYGAAYRLVTPWLMAASVVGLLALPQLARLVHADPAQVHPLVGAMSRTMVAIGLPVAVGATLTSGQLVGFVFGADYASSALPLGILIWSCVTVYSNAPFGFLMLARGQDRAYMWAAVAGAAANFLPNLVLIPALGMLGAAITTMLAELTVLSLIIRATREVSPRILAGSLVRAAPAAALMAVAVFPLRESLWAFPVGVITYAAAAAFTGAVPGVAPLRRLIAKRAGAKR